VAPPVHHVVRGVRHVGPRRTQSVDVRVPEGGPHPLVPDERRVPYDKIRVRPRGWPRVREPLDRDTCIVVRDLLPCGWMQLLGVSVPPRERLPIRSIHDTGPVMNKQCVAALDVLVVIHYGFRRFLRLPICLVMPLEVTDP
jgi:hypothetical protein